MEHVNKNSISAKLARFFALLGGSKRMLLIVSPFLVIVIVLVWLAILSIDILAAGRAYVEGESLWSKNQKEAVFHLLRFADTRDEADFEKYRKAIKVPQGYGQARLELEKANPDNAIVRAGFLDGGTHPEDLSGVLRLYERFHKISYMKSVLDI